MVGEFGIAVPVLEGVRVLKVAHVWCPCDRTRVVLYVTRIVVIKDTSVTLVVFAPGRLPRSPVPVMAMWFVLVLVPVLKDMRWDVFRLAMVTPVVPSFLLRAVSIPKEGSSRLTQFLGVPVLAKAQFLLHRFSTAAVLLPSAPSPMATWLSVDTLAELVMVQALLLSPANSMVPLLPLAMLNLVLLTVVPAVPLTPVTWMEDAQIRAPLASLLASAGLRGPPLTA